MLGIVVSGRRIPFVAVTVRGSWRSSSLFLGGFLVDQRWTVDGIDAGFYVTDCR